MFERRVKTVLIAFGLVCLIYLARLIQLQVFQVEDHRLTAARALLGEPEAVPFVRGSILDRGGVALAQDAPCWDIRLDYRIISEDEKYLEKLAKNCLRQQRYPSCVDLPSVKAALQLELAKMWNELAIFDNVTLSRLEECKQSIRQRVEAIFKDVWDRRGFEEPVREQIQSHAVVDGLNSEQQVEARMRFAKYPWLKIEDSVKRVYPCGSAFGHLVGRMRPVDAERIAEDPFADESLRKYVPYDQAGSSGVERLAEERLRGRRGLHQTDRAGNIIEDIPPLRGSEVRLTLRSDLQNRLYELLGEALEFPSKGGAIVVIHVPTRELLALVSYPAFDPDRFNEEFDELREDTINLPLRPRAVANQFAPGSIVKPLACLAGLSAGVITPETQFTCTGSLFPEQPDRFRCWPIARTSQRKAHGTINMIEAISGSCNVYHYHVGERVGVDRLTRFFEHAGLGRTTGTGLREEAEGINPTPQWLWEIRKSRPTDADARFFAIGQGEISVTPIQAANLMAVYASGVYQPVRLLLDDPAPPRWELPVKARDWQSVREGVYRVSNDPEGTAYEHAHLDPATGYALCGKTGSAESPRLHTSFRVSYRDETGAIRAESVAAGSRKQVRDEWAGAHPEMDPEGIEIEDEGFWPPMPSPDGRNYSHAWFGGYLQPLRSDGKPDYSETAPIALSVLVEFGGSGARTAAPIARRASEVIREVLGAGLDPDFGLSIQPRAVTDQQAPR